MNDRDNPTTDSSDRREGRFLLALASSFLLLFLVLPLAALLLRAAREGAAGKLSDPALAAAFKLSLTTSLAATVLAVLAGLPLALLLARVPFRGRALVDTLVDLPTAIPPVVAGVALLLAFGRAGLAGRAIALFGWRLPFSTAAVVIAQTFIAAPLFVRAARAGFESVPRELEEAAMTLGRNRWRTTLAITIPLAAPALAAGALLAFARALGEFGATMMFAGNLPGVTQTLPLAVMSAMEGDLSLAIAISALSIVLAFASLAASRLVVRHWSRR